jgi:hypothetical protein
VLVIGHGSIHLIDAAKAFEPRQLN